MEKCLDRRPNKRETPEDKGDAGGYNRFKRVCDNENIEGNTSGPFPRPPLPSLASELAKVLKNTIEYTHSQNLIVITGRSLNIYI